MRIDELTQELHAQADEAMTCAPVAMADLRARRGRDRRRRAAGGTLAVLLVTGGAWLGVPVVRAGSDQPGPAGTTTAPKTRESAQEPKQAPGWRPVRCNRPELGGCGVPATLTYDGRTYSDRVGGSQPLFAPNGINRELNLSTHAATDLRLVLVGAVGAGPGSRLEVTVGSGPARRLPRGRLTVWLLPEPKRPQEVVVRETGTPAKGEVLRIEGYSREP